MDSIVGDNAVLLNAAEKDSGNSSTVEARSYLEDVDDCSALRQSSGMPVAVPVPVPGSPCAPEYEVVVKPNVAMIFDTLEEVEGFYKSYAYRVGFSVRIGQGMTKNGVEMYKRFLCSREGQYAYTGIGKFSGGKRTQKVTRCGCEAMIAVKRTADGKYVIYSFIESHKHGLVTPAKKQRVRSRSEVSHRAKMRSTKKQQINNVDWSKGDLENYQNDNTVLLNTSEKDGDTANSKGSSCAPEYEVVSKPKLGMIFDTLDAAEGFYKSYARHVGFSVRVGQRIIKDGVIAHKRFLCSKQGFKLEKVQSTNKGTGKFAEGKRKRNRKITRCGCEAMMSVKRSEDGKYVIYSFIESHTHELVTPDKKQPDKVKTRSTKKQRISNVGCTKTDLQNDDNGLKCSINLPDVRMFVEHFKRKKKAIPTFFYEHGIDDKGRLRHVFWADKNCKINYAHFGDVVSFDLTYGTNQYDMVLTVFTGVNHHMAYVCFGVALLANENVESYTWLFQTFLRAMGGVAPKLILTDEDLSMKHAIKDVFRNAKHQLSMWHVLRRLPENIDSQLSSNPQFDKCFKSCVHASETPEEFESTWCKMLSEFGLEKNDWLASKYDIRESWVPAYFKGLFLGCMLRTTSRSEMGNTFFHSIMGHRLCLIEVWLIFDTAMEAEQYRESLADNDSLHKMPQLQSSWDLEKHASAVFTPTVFELFQAELIAARDECGLTNVVNVGKMKFAVISDETDKTRDVSCDTSSMIAKCSCKLFESEGIPCRHIIALLKSAKVNELPSYYVLERWTKLARRDPELAMRKMAWEMRRELEMLIQSCGECPEKMKHLQKRMSDFKDSIKAHLGGKQV